jgi:hypothetical protein
VTDFRRQNADTFATRSFLALGRQPGAGLRAVNRSGWASEHGSGARIDPNPTATTTSTPTPTPTSIPGPPTLIQPANGAVLPQPVAPNEWLFTWDARRGPCSSTISIAGPGGRHLGATIPGSQPYEFRFTTDAPIPNDSLGPWTWSVTVDCPLASARSETRTFEVEPVATPTPTRPTGPRDLVGICHGTGRDGNRFVYLEIDSNAVAAHLAHGDFRAQSPASCTL